MESITEIRNNKVHTLLKADQIQGDPVVMVGTNIPSIFGGAIEEPWYRNRKTRALPHHIIGDERLGT